MSNLPLFNDLWKAEEFVKESERALSHLKPIKGLRKIENSSVFGLTFDNNDSSYDDDQVIYCCEKPFYTKELLLSHQNSQHLRVNLLSYSNVITQCSVDGCAFIGDDDSLQVHNFALHSSPSPRKLDLESSSSAVQKWINERRRKYPTLRKQEERKMKKMSNVPGMACYASSDEEACDKDASTKTDKKMKDPFLSNPLVQMQKERAKCMKKFAKIHKRPRLLQMLRCE
ncbi:nuclear fragile X mental retardation protein interacting protein 1 [Cichlidogyrus casuarinus]|uniref:Nuclear fragile X mental retardation protein interacting protein 1 n=1 Tax=Cichlidogyrus casuarinus TaxID=1844966 RepID=A0ABD2QDX7_9PLAT